MQAGYLPDDIRSAHGAINKLVHIHKALQTRERNITDNCKWFWRTHNGLLSGWPLSVSRVHKEAEDQIADAKVNMTPGNSLPSY